jgi:hypothetical protein
MGHGARSAPDAQVIQHAIYPTPQNDVQVGATLVMMWL